jgi:hypothetical protein
MGTRIHWALALVTVSSLLFAGCVGGDRPCVIEATLTEVPDDREAFHVTSEAKENHPWLADLFASEGTTIELECSQGEQRLQRLAQDGADVEFSDEQAGHDVYLRHEGDSYHAVLAKVVS